MKKIASKTKTYLKKYFKTQVVITLVSLPILVNWGIPISTMSIIGNILFIPFITTFLVLSSLLFFSELLYIPNHYIATCLNMATKTMYSLLQVGNKYWLVGFAKKNSMFLIALPIITILILRRRNSTIYLCSMLLISIGLLICYKPPLQEEFVPLTQNKLLIKYNKNGLSIIDYGHFNKKASPENYVNYELKPYLIQRFGTLSIEDLTLNRPGIRSFRSAIALSKFLHVNSVSINFNNTKLSKYAWKCFYDLKNVVEKNNGKMNKNRRKSHE